MKRKSPIVFYVLTFLVAITGCSPLPAETHITSTPSPLPTQTVTLELVSPTTAPNNPSEEKETIGKDGMEMVFIPGGEFTMGWVGIDATIQNGPGPTADFMEFPVTVDDFWIDKHEVTISQYNQCVEAGACTPFHQNNLTPYGLDYFTDPKYDNYPVVNVSWYMARDYCTWAGRRMVTEAEWERAARGEDGRKYPWGNEPYADNLANICDKDCPTSRRGAPGNPNFDDGYAGPAPVGSFPAGASPYGVLDMAGNVWEWTSSAADPYPYDAHDGRESQYDIEYGSKWPERILRGGPWNDGYAYVRSSFRYRAVAIYWNNNMGIRCAVSDLSQMDQP
jgi:formylglycine-generating enzyme required for sulfatase activity